MKKRKAFENEKTVLKLSEKYVHLTQEDWFNALIEAMNDEFDIIEFESLRDSQQDSGIRHGKPYRATREEAQAHIDEWKKYLKSIEDAEEHSLPFGEIAIELDKDLSDEQVKILEKYVGISSAKKKSNVEYDKNCVVGHRTVIGADGKVKVDEPLYKVVWR